MLNEKDETKENCVKDSPKKYKLLGADGKIYLSETPGKFGGNSELKVYGTLKCGSALASIRKYPGVYIQHRVFFADEKTALAAGYRPCGNCLRGKYREYMADAEKYKEKFGL
ncbi:MAG: metal-binding protein [Clostridia bacterium]|nr:metal-binding protein [Clostridia bacterium]